MKKEPAVHSLSDAKKRERMSNFLIVLPFLIFIFAFSYVPLFGWGFSLFNYKAGIPWNKLEFVGLDHFVKMFGDKNILRTLSNTLVMSGIGLLLSPLPMVFAIMMNEIRLASVKKVVQTVTTLPNFISWIVVYGLTFVLFSSNGLVNQILDAWNIAHSAQGLLGDGEHVWAFQAALQQWKGLGWSSIVYMASISGIDSELYDAASVDGANRVQKIWHVTVPGLLPTYFVLLLLSISNILSSGFDQYYVFWNALVADKIEVLDYYVYKLAFSLNQYSYSIAVGIVKSLVSILLLFTANWFSKKTRGTSMV